MSKTILINRLPTPTWNRLGVNGTSLEWDDAGAQDLGSENISGQSAPIRLQITGQREYSRKDIELHAQAGQNMVMYQIMDGQGSLLVNTHIIAEQNAHVQLVQIQANQAGSRLRCEVRGECAENSRIQLTQILLGRGDAYTDSRFELNGSGSALKADIGYLEQNTQTVDINLSVNHWGTKTTSEIAAAGTLKDAAKKIFRGTIDFKKGSADSVGSENETVLMLGDDAVNKTVPLILCAEENVVGNHGASIGELDKDTLFYFQSRGFSKDQAENIMARASIERLANTLEDEAIRQTVLQALNEVL